MKKRIGLYGGTFDPVHVGHYSLANSFLNSGFIDSLWILLTPDPPHKPNMDFSSFEHRFAMLELAFQDLDQIHISTLEQELPKPSYTYRTIRHVKMKHPDVQFFYCMGEDSLVNFHTWKNPDEILEEVSLLIAERPNFDHSKLSKKLLDKCKFIPHSPIDVSSTQIRDRVSGNKSLQPLVDQRVESYIRTHHLYQ